MFLAAGNASTTVLAEKSNQPASHGHRNPFGFVFGGLMIAGVLVARPKRIGTIAGLMLLAALTLSLPACGGGSSGGGGGGGGNGTNVTPGTYTLTVVGSDTSSSTISGSTAVKVTVQ
jgi:hypothetical protein